MICRYLNEEEHLSKPNKQKYQKTFCLGQEHVTNPSDELRSNQKQIHVGVRPRFWTVLIIMDFTSWEDLHRI